jgi:arylsulfatase A-like enzyme
MILRSLYFWFASAGIGIAQPNVVLFLVDDMGWRDCGAYGSTYYETPRMDAFAKEAMRFTQAYSQPLCSPTRASLLTGQYSARHGITRPTGHIRPQAASAELRPKEAPVDVAWLMPESRNYLPTSHVTLAETLKAAGYATAHIGKWHLGLTQPHWPEAHGFEVTWHCHPDPGPPGEYFSPYGVLPQTEPRPKMKVGNITDGPPGEYIVDRQADEAIKFIQANKQKPFFLNLWCYGVHGPWGHKEEYTKYFAGKKDPAGLQGNPIMASMLKSVDECFGRIWDELKKQGLAENTIIIFNSDNGGNSHSNSAEDPKAARKTKEMAAWRKWAGDQGPTNNHPLRDDKGSLYEGGTRVPLMWSWPGKIPTGSVAEDVVAHIDVYPTLLELLGLAKPEGHIIDGVSYASVLKGTGKLERKAFFNYFPHNGPGGATVRSGNLKLIRRFSDPVIYELYDLEKDIGESINLAEKMPEKVKELDALISEFLLNTKAEHPILNPAYKPKPSAPADPLGGLKERGVKLTLSGGIAKMIPVAKGEHFLGYPASQHQGPATLKLRVKSAEGGAGKVESFPNRPGDTAGMKSTTFSIPAGDWQEVSIDLASPESLGTLRIHFPATELELDWMELKPQGKAVRWEF